MFERVCFVFHDRQRVFKHTYIIKSLQVRSNLLEIAKTITGRGVLVSLARQVGCRACKTLHKERGFEAHIMLNLAKKHAV